MDDPLIGKVLCGHRFERILARGESESVYLASQLSVARAVVAKVLSPQMAAERGHVARFLALARRAGKLKHAGIVELHEVCQQGGIIFYTMEYLSGGTLTQWVERRGPISVRQYVQRMGIVVDALLYGEEQGIVHGGLDPDHLLIARDGRLKILGLGLQDPESSGIDLDRIGSRLRLVCLAPEQVRPGIGPRTADSRTDMYALGSTSYYALTGQPPFAGGSTEDILAAKRLHKLTPLGELRPEIPGELTALVETMMALSPERRLQSFREVQSSLGSFSESLRAIREASEPTVPMRKRVEREATGGRLLRFTLGVAGLLTVAAVCAYLTIGSGPETTELAPSSPTVLPATSQGVGPGPSATITRTKNASAAISRIQGLSQAGRYREALDELARLSFQIPDERRRFEEAANETRAEARSELRGVLDQANGHVGLGEYAKALGILADIAERLPRDLADEAETHCAGVEDAQWRSGLDAALRSVSMRIDSLDFEGALGVLEAVPAGGRRDRADRLSAVREELLAARELAARLTAAAAPAWAALRGSFRDAYPEGDEFSDAIFRSTLLRVAARLYLDEVDRAERASLFRGAFRSLEGGEIELSYDFSSSDQLEDFRPVGGADTRMEIRGGHLVIQGECRFLEGAPFRGVLGASLDIAAYEEESPNINVALWTAATDRISYREDTAGTGGVEPSGANGRDQDFVAFCAGYRLEDPLIHYLKVRGSETRVLFPCHAIFQGRHGSSLHDDLRWECDWGQDLLSGLHGMRTVDLAVGPTVFRWVVQGTALHEKVDAALVAKIQDLAAKQLGGSVTVFTNGSVVHLDALTITGRPAPDWIAERVRKLAIQKLKALLEDIPWDEALAR